MKEAAEVYADNGESALWIQTYKGGRFYLNDPKFDIEEIAHSLSLQCRFTGHIKNFYSVAEHSVLVAGITAHLEGDKFEGLMHDAHEAYFSDLASPWKAVVPDYKKREKSLEAAMRKQFGLAPTISETVKKADWVALFIEAKNLLNGSLDGWEAPEGVKELAAELGKEIEPNCWIPREAEKMFLQVYNAISPGSN